MILQTGMRTDIPAFYSEWFFNRLKAGFVLVRNPYDPSRVTRYSLSPKVVDLIGFCTKNPGPMLPGLDALSPYGQYWHVTITPYGRDIEPRVPDRAVVMDHFRRLSDALGPDAVGWRYDPILVNDVYTLERHVETFDRMAATLSGYTRACVVSFIDMYEKVKRNFPEIGPVRREDRLAIGRAFAEIGVKRGIVIKACGEGRELEPFGVDCDGCMTRDMYERALGRRLRFPRYKPARESCACYLGGDIGAYNSCPHLCRYCYANYDAEAVRLNRRRHDPNSPFLIGGAMPGDIIHRAEQVSWADNQLSMWDDI